MLEEPTKDGTPDEAHRKFFVVFIAGSIALRRKHQHPLVFIFAREAVKQFSDFLVKVLIYFFNVKRFLPLCYPSGFSPFIVIFQRR